MAASSVKNAYGKYQSVIISALSQEKAAERARELAAGILCTGEGKNPAVNALPAARSQGTLIPTLDS